MTKRQQLSIDVERALAEYLGVPVFDAPEYPQLAEAFARAVASSQVDPGMASPREVAYNAKELTDAIATLVTCVSALVE